MTDPSNMEALAARRRSEDRQALGLPMPEPIDVADFYASRLEALALEIRTGRATVTNIKQTKETDQFPLPLDGPGGVWQFQATGKLSFAVDYTHQTLMAAHADAFKAWSEAHPDLVPMYVRSRREG